jgi:FtsP/CotA-like multicopper oxidase with cupredoxin domain
MISLTRRALCATMALAPWQVRSALAAAGGNEPFRLVASPDRAGIATPEMGETEVWSFGSVPGPEIRVRAGERVRVLLDNRLAEPTTIHWHGIRIDNAMDGVPGLTQEPVRPGATFLYDFIAPDPGTYWYHSHFRSFEQIERGLYGALVVTGDEAAPLRDITLLIDDWRLEETGLIHEASFGSPMDASHAGRLGNWLTVNGRSGPVVGARPGERLRLRMISAANARVMSFDLGGADAWIVALDGWPLDRPLPVSGALELAPAQRADVIMDMPAGSGRLELSELSTGERLPACAIEVAGPAAPTASGDEPRIEPREDPRLDLERALRIPLVMEGGAMGPMAELTFDGRPIAPREMMRRGLFWAFNGEVGDLRSDAPLARAAIGETVVIELDNRTAWPHAMHLHGNHMRIVAGNRRPAPATAWRDTIPIRPEERLELAFVADNPGKWLFHCHMLEHAASGMSTWIAVG